MLEAVLSELADEVREVVTLYYRELRDAAGAALADMRSLVEAAGLEITLEAGAALPARGDPNWARQVITGLVENALRHARSGGVIRLRAEAEGVEALVRVIDNGPGIAAPDLEAVTERFVQARCAAAKSEGFGIGLALAHWIVDQQGGRITLESPVPDPFRAGQAPGTLVTVFLPGAPE